MTRKHFVTYKTFDVITVLFPFTDKSSSKRRPALVLSDYSSFNQESQHCVLAMITSQQHSPWPLDVIINDYKSAGLTTLCTLRMKLFTLDNQLIIRKIGHLSKSDQLQVSSALQKLLPFKL